MVKWHPCLVSGLSRNASNICLFCKMSMHFSYIALILLRTVSSILDLQSFFLFFILKGYCILPDICCLWVPQWAAPAELSTNTYCSFSSIIQLPCHDFSSVCVSHDLLHSLLFKKICRMISWSFVCLF